MILLLTSCFKEDVKIEPHLPGDVNTVQIQIGYPYLNQVYYNCEQNKIVSTNSRYDWDLAFESSPSGYHIKLNTAKGMLSSNQGDIDFINVISASGLDWQWDNSNGDLSETAIGEWTPQTTYVLNLQSDEAGNSLGYKKIKFESVTDSTYTFSYANLDGSNFTIFELEKNNAVNFVHFSFVNGGVAKNIEPPKADWDLCFTNYQNFFSNLPLPFVITGVLSNRYSGIRIAEDTLSQFAIIELKDTINYDFTQFQDEIGYDWKIRNSADNSFTIDDRKSYILKNQNGLYFKIRFIDFYNSTGSKGYPTFEIQKM
jgi:hypothetical protein